MKYFIWIICALPGVAFLISGCGSEDPSTAPAIEEPSVTVSPKADEESETVVAHVQSDLEAITEKAQLEAQKVLSTARTTSVEGYKATKQAIIEIAHQAETKIDAVVDAAAEELKEAGASAAELKETALQKLRNLSEKDAMSE